jgi:hypothetical protein
MTIHCTHCQELVPEHAAFCISCGALLRPTADIRRQITPAASGTTVHLRPTTLSSAGSPNILAPTRSGLAEAVIALVALCFAVIELTGIAQLIAQNDWASWNLWPAVLLASGALLAENDWVNGALRRGLYGIVCWGMLPWLLVAEQDMAWLMLPPLGWWLIWMCDRRVQ